MPSRQGEVDGRPCIRCAATTCSHTDYPLCGVCFRYLCVAYCGPRHLTQGIRDGMAALDHYREHAGLTGPAPTSEVWAWLYQYLACRGAYARSHHGRIPPTGRERGIYSTESLRKLTGADRL